MSAFFASKKVYPSGIRSIIMTLAHTVFAPAGAASRSASGYSTAAIAPQCRLTAAIAHRACRKAALRKCRERPALRPAMHRSASRDL